MSKKFIVFIIVASLLIIGGGVLLNNFSGENSAENAESQCEISEMIFYYTDQCQWCQKVKNEGTVAKIEKFGVKIKKINANMGLVRHQFRSVPTFVISEKVYSGYKTFEELKELLGCHEEKN